MADNIFDRLLNARSDANPSNKPNAGARDGRVNQTKASQAADLGFVGSLMKLFTPGNMGMINVANERLKKVNQDIKKRPSLTDKR